MKSVPIVILTVLFFLTPMIFAHEEISTPEEMMKTMVARQNVTDISQIDCSKISVEDFEFLGDSIMERMLGSHELHEQMDAMMGGEGSASLKQMHITMGSNWLGCHEGMDMSGMMDRSMMPMMMRMMGAYYPAYYNGFDAVLLLAIVGWILFIITLVYLLTKVKKQRK